MSIIHAGCSCNSHVIMPSARLLSTFAYIILLLLTLCATLLSCVALLSQSVRNSPNRVWKNNINALVIGSAYVIVVGPS